MKFNLKTLSVVLLYAGVISPSFGEALDIDKVEVVSQTPLATLGVPVNEVPSNVQVANSKNIQQQQPQTLADFINDNLGSVNISNGTGSPVQPDVEYRGFTASPQLGQPIGLSVYLDGVRFNEAFGDIVNWDLIPMNAISTINLMPGSNPLFGLNTLGGALAVNTKNGAEFQGTSATASVGSWGGRQFQFETGGIIKDYDLDYYTAGNFSAQNGWRQGSSNDLNQIFSKLRWHSDTSALELSLALADNDMNQAQTIPSSMAAVNPRQLYTGPDWVKNQMAFVNLKGSTFISDTKLLEGNVYFKRSNSQGMNSNAGLDECLGFSTSTNYPCTAYTGGGNTGYLNNVDASNAYSNIQQSTVGLSAQMSFLDDLFGYHNKFTGGASADISRVSFNQNTFAAQLVGDDTINDPTQSPYLQDAVNFAARNYYYGLFATDTISPLEHLNITGSARYNVAEERLSGNDNDVANNSPINSLAGSHTYSRLNPAIGLTYSPDKALNIYAGYNEGMRAPNALELECSDPTKPCSMPTGFTADPNMKMVVSKTWEGGFRGRLDGGWHWNAGAFVTNTTNDIQYVVSSTTTGYFSDVGTTKRQGVELGFGGKIYDINLNANYSYVDATYQSDFTMGTNSTVANNGCGGSCESVTKGNQIPGIAKNTIKLRADTYLIPNLNVGATAVLISSQWAHGDENNLDPQGRIPGYGIINFDAHYKIDNNWNLFTKVTNLLDKQYSTYGIISGNIYAQTLAETNPQLFISPAAPRAAWVGLTYNFGGINSVASTVDKD